jgi:cobalamin biosynthesis Co2+ chelatase CbiK
MILKAVNDLVNEYLQKKKELKENKDLINLKNDYQIKINNILKKI